MSAYIYPVYNVYCADCAAGSGPHEYADDAEEWANEHDAENHEAAQ